MALRRSFWWMPPTSPGQDPAAAAGPGGGAGGSARAPHRARRRRRRVYGRRRLPVQLQRERQGTGVQRGQEQQIVVLQLPHPGGARGDEGDRRVSGACTPGLDVFAIRVLERVELRRKWFDGLITWCSRVPGFRGGMCVPALGKLVCRPVVQQFADECYGVAANIAMLTCGSF